MTAATAASGQGLMLGINLAGGEFGQQPGRYGYDYIYPSTTDIDYHASKGLDVIRLPFKWERVQPEKYGALDQAEVARIEQVVDYANSKGMHVVLDLHNYGYGYGAMVGSAETPNAAYADFWGKFAGEFADKPNVMFGLMNEPHTQSATEWVESANAGIAAIRDAGATQQVLVPGTYWDGAWTWVGTDNDTVVGAGVKDPANNYAFEVHQYLDSDGSGTHAEVVSTTAGVERLTEITNWAESTGNKLFLGEFGVANDQASLTALDNMLSYMKEHPQAWQGATYWAGGPWWGDYMYSAEPRNGVDSPQMAILSKYADSDTQGVQSAMIADAGSQEVSQGDAGMAALASGVADASAGDGGSGGQAATGAGQGEAGSNAATGDASSAGTGSADGHGADHGGGASTVASETNSGTATQVGSAAAGAGTGQTANAGAGQAAGASSGAGHACGVATGADQVADATGTGQDSGPETGAGAATGAEAATETGAGDSTDHGHGATTGTGEVADADTGAGADADGGAAGSTVGSGSTPAADPVTPPPAGPLAALPANWGNDIIDGSAGVDHLHGGHGDDIVSGLEGADRITGDYGDDILLGGVGADRMSGGRGEDVLFGGAGNDVLEGGSSNDVLMGAAGSDTIDGGTGLDTLLLSDGMGDYLIAVVGEGEVRIADMDGGIDVVTGVEYYRFLESGGTYVVENGVFTATAEAEAVDELLSGHMLEELIQAEATAEADATVTAQAGSTASGTATAASVAAGTAATGSASASATAASTEATHAHDDGAAHMHADLLAA
jgi:aryl-phospho-beta-D-glucosidase BglC (GH1 family)